MADGSNTHAEVDGPSGIIIERLDVSDVEAWERFCQTHPHSTFFHRWGWLRAINAVHGHETFGLIARTGEGQTRAIRGILPLVAIRSRLTGNALVSTGFTVGGGILADDPVVHRALADAAIKWARENGMVHVELRDAESPGPNWQARDDLYCGFSMKLGKTPEETLKLIPRKRRAEIRKAIKFAEEGTLSVSFDRDLNRFHALYAHGLRDLGTPVFSRKFVYALDDVFGDDVDYITVLADGKPVAALMSFYHRDTVLPYYVGALPAARGLRAFDFIYWHQMCRALERGCTRFDFGRSKVDTGSFAFKKTWGIEPTPLTYHFALLFTQTIPNINPNNPKFRLATQVWQRLPVPVATLGGRLIARHFG